MGALICASAFLILGTYSLLSYSVPADLGAHVAATAAGILTVVRG